MSELASHFHPVRWTAAIFVAIMAVLVVSGIVVPDLAWSLLYEAGPIESFSPIFWFMATAGAVIAAIHRQGERLELLMLGIVFGAFGMRELDLHKDIYGWSITRLINYSKDAIPLDERLSAFLLILLPLAIAALVLVLMGGRRIVRAWRHGQIWPRWVAYWMLLIICAYGADKLSGLAVQGTAQATGWFLLLALEETLETVLALYSLLLMIPLASYDRGK